MTKVPPFIGDFSDDDIAWVIRVGVRRHVPAGERIIVEGEEARDVFVILAGAFLVASRQLELPNMKRLGPGELVGEMSFVNKQLPISSVSALEDSEVLCIPRTALSEKIAADSGFQGRFHKVVSEFTVDRLYAWWAPPPRDPPPLDEAVASLRVYELIERMLRGEFPEPPLPPPPREPDGNEGRA
ncbi:MAG TPA: cyclic nucleotide-binding domain-containing protein, partial [Longimicrobium sp.]|nr:cyclic nucleotide-binding domain-containing protein [Longimicrobium sp.]